MRILGSLVVFALVACGSEGSKDATEAPGAGGGAGAQGSAGSQATGDNPGAAAAGGTGGAPGSSHVELPRVYPPVRAATPTGLIADPLYATLAAPVGLEKSGVRLGRARQALGDAITLGTAIQERFYTAGPTHLLRIVKDLDERVQPLDIDAASHPCLAAAPSVVTYSLPGGQSFQVHLQCLQEFGAAGWVAFGFGPAAPRPFAGPLVSDAGVADAGAPDASTPGFAAPPGATTDAGAEGTGEDFYLIQGQPGGNGGAYRIDAHGNVEGWLAVAERDLPSNSQVIMHLWVDKDAGTLELTLGGSGVGFCSAHLKTNTEFLFISGKTNAPPPPGETPEPGSQYCDAPRTGCFEASALGTDLGDDAASCAGLSAGTFELGVNIDAAPEGNVVPANIYEYFSELPSGIASF